MNAEQLLAHFERISEAPDATARLRRFILDLAVRGKLVEQDPEDEPVEDLLQRIAVEMTSRRSTRARSTPDERVEGWCSIPASWNFVRLDKVCTVIMGSSPPGSTYNKTGDGVPLINGPVEFTPGPFGRTTINQYTTDPSAFCELGDFLVCVRGSTTGRTNIAAFRACIGRGVAAIQPLFEDKFIRIAIRVRQEAILQMGRGIAFPSISREQLSGLPVPLPPLAEQHRIVVKVDELMALCDQLEAARQQREQKRECLVAATLQRFNHPAEDPTSFRQDASFALQVLPCLITTPAQIKQLRQAILNLAVRGKLVEQDPEDEPAEELLGRILELKIRTTGKLPKSDLQLIDRLFNDEPFAIPDSWTWVVLGQITDLITSGSRDWAKHYSDSGAIFVRMGNLAKGDYRLRLGSIQHVSPPAGGEGTRTRLETWDVLVSITGDVGMLGLIPEGFGEAYINQHTALARPCFVLKGRYLPEFLRSDFAQSQFQEPQRGIKNSFRLSDLSGIVVPLPPLAEQHRIVAKVDELMALCDQLEQQLSQADQQRRRLLEAVLAEALLEPEKTLEAAYA
jgi:type I restriction enzyme S subunit